MDDLQQSVYKCIQAEHPDVTYYKREDISLILSKGLSNTVREKPRNPIEYFSNWLLEYSKVQKQANEIKCHNKEVAKLVVCHQTVLEKEAAEREEKEKIAAAKEAENKKFWDDLHKSQDPYDNLEAFSQYIHNNVGSTGVYIGQLEPPRKEAEEDADEEAHLDRDKAELIKFKFANSDHRGLIVGTDLQQGQGITHDVFSEEFTAANQKVRFGEGCAPLCDQFRHIYVKEVVRNPKMHYWKVPRLGSYMAIPLVYKSALSVSSFEHSVAALLEYERKVKAQDEEKILWDMRQDQAKQDKVASGAIKEEEWVPETREWEPIAIAPVETSLTKFVVCIDSMGQDREFTKDQQEFALDSVYQFRKYWEEYEQTRLLEDRDALIELKDEDAEIFTEEYAADKEEKGATLVENFLNPPKEEGAEEEWVDPDAPLPDPFIKKTEVAKIKLKYLLDQLTDAEGPYKKRFESLVDRKVVKLQPLFKAIFYFLDYDKEKVCVEKSQQLFWKKAKDFWKKDLTDKMYAYVFQGPKNKTIKSYQKINFVENQCLKQFDLQTINEYNYSLGLIFKWMNLAIETRKQDIIHRLSGSKVKREERAQKEEEARQRADDRANALAEAKDKFEVENKDEIGKYEEYQSAVAAGEENGGLEAGEEAPTKPIFDENFFFFNWDEEHPEIDIPEEVKDDVDNDWMISIERKDDLVAQYQQQVADETTDLDKSKQGPPYGKK